ncbi:MAG TPA: hypothetical protein VIK31_03255 [Propionibacteriaceae bacterium]
MTTWLDSKAVERFHDDLAAIPTLFADLPAVKTGIKDPTNGARKPPASKPPLSIEVVTLLDTEKKDADEYQETDPRGHDVLDRYGVIPRIGLWLRMAVEEMTDAGETVPPIDGWMNLDQVCHSIQQLTPWLIGQQWVTELAQDMHALRAEIEAALGIAKEFKPRCRELWCGTLLDAMDNGSWYSCPGCKREYIIAEDLKALGDAQYLRDEEIAQLLDVPRSTVRYWKQVGWVHAIATTASGVLLYDLDQVRIVRDTPPAERVRP